MCTGGLFSIGSRRVDPRGVLALQLGEWHDVNLLCRKGLKDLCRSSSDAFFVANERDGPAEELMGDPTGVEPSVETC